MGYNPCKTFVYREFYRKYATDAMEPYKAYLPASVYDNPFISEHYITNLKKLDKVNRERLLEGNWEYDDDHAKLFDYDKILNLFTNDYALPTKHQAYISCDVARAGRDKTVIMVWEGLYVKKIHVFAKSTIPEVVESLKSLSYLHKVPRGNIVIDEDGVGGGVVDYLPNCKGFVNNSSPKETKGSKKVHNYANLKTQCYFKLAELINSDQMGCAEIHSEVKDLLIEDLEQVAQKDIDKDGKIQLLGKEKIKENIGRSPDYSDALMMRMYFEVNPEMTAYVSV